MTPGDGMSFAGSNAPCVSEAKCSANQARNFGARNVCAVLLGGDGCRDGWTFALSAELGTLTG